MRSRVPLLLAALGCHDPDVEPPALIDTGWFPDDDGLCGEVVEATTPEDGEAGWYWRDPLTVLLAEAGDATAVRLVDDGGAEVPVVVERDPSGLRLTVTPTGGLIPASRHRLQITDCRGTREVTFTTSELGLPIEGGAASLAGRTWRLDLVHGDWVQPGGFGAVLAGLVDLPVLIGITYVDAGHLDLLGAVGRSNGAVIVQDTTWPTWDLPLGDFGGAPWFRTSTDRVVWQVSGGTQADAVWPLPIEDFALAGTFSPDGDAMGGVVITGLVDTRGVGGALGKPGVEHAVCDFAGGLGVSCIPCADGEALCLQAEVRDMTAVEQPGVTLQPVGGP